MRGRGLAALALVLVAVAPAVAQSDRDRALADLGRRDNAEARRAAALWLGIGGDMGDMPALSRALSDPDPVVRGLIEAAMWRVWSRSGDADVDRLFAAGVGQLSTRALEAAAQTFTQVIERRPQFAEGWNKRATVYYLLGDYTRSLADCDEVMKRNPYHWGALSGYGMIYIQLDQPGRAIEYLEKALRVNPNLDQVAETIEVLKSLMLQRRRDTI